MNASVSSTPARAALGQRLARLAPQGSLSSVSSAIARAEGMRRQQHEGSLGVRRTARGPHVHQDGGWRGWA